MIFIQEESNMDALFIIIWVDSPNIDLTEGTVDLSNFSDFILSIV